MSEHPESLAAYTDFWKDYDVPEAQSLMKMLHSIAEAGTGNANLQITNMLQRVQEMQQLSDQRQDESSRIYLYSVKNSLNQRINGIFISGVWSNGEVID